MRWRGQQSGSASRDVLALIGLSMIVASLAWLQFFPSTKFSTRIEPRRADQGVALVVIDPGHGGVDSGAICAGLLEKDLTLDVAQRVRRIAQARGFHTLLTRDCDEYRSLRQAAPTSATGSATASSSVFILMKGNWEFLQESKRITPRTSLSMRFLFLPGCRF